VCPSPDGDSTRNILKENCFLTFTLGYYGFGGLFRLMPPSAPNITRAESTVYAFHGTDGAFPEPGLVFDANGNLYGASLGSPAGSPDGNIFELAPTSAGTRSESVLYDFVRVTHGYSPNGGQLMDIRAVSSAPLLRAVNSASG
jgi:hypothetical protein